MNYLNYKLSLQEIALTRIAVQLCHSDENFKKEVLCFAESEYGKFYSHRYQVIKDETKVWEEIIEKKSKTLCEEISFLPPALKSKLIIYIQAIALQWLSWCKQQEVMFGITRFITADFLTPTDWTLQGRLNERNVAKRLVQDQRIDIWQRYRLACIYFLTSSIPKLWQQIPSERRKAFFNASEDFNEVKQEKLVRLWSYYIIGKVERLIGDKTKFWHYAFRRSVDAGESVAVSYCWEKLSQEKKQAIVVEAALRTFYGWVNRKNSVWMRDLVIDSQSWLATPAQYNDILFFLLSQMTEEQQVTFFQKTFALEDRPHHLVLRCFLEWPYQDFFIPTITRLWGILPERQLGQLLLIIARKYTNRDRFINQKDNEDYDYQFLLLELWEQTPVLYKRYLFSDTPSRDLTGKAILINEGKELLLEVLQKQPLDQSALYVFKRVYQEATVEERKNILYSQCGETICANLISGEKWDLVNFILNTCLIETESINFKKQFVFSDEGRSICFGTIEAEHEDYFVNQLFNWAGLSTEEVSKFKYDLMFWERTKTICKDLILENQLDCVDRVMRWFLPSGRDQQQFKEALKKAYGMDICVYFLESVKWERLECFLTWCFSSEEAIEQFKQQLFFEEGEDLHFHFMRTGCWQTAELFFKWCRLSPETIKQFKKDTLFSDRALDEFPDMLLCREADDEYFLKNGGKWQSIALYLRWCLTDTDMLLEFKNKIETIYKSYTSLCDRDKLELQIFDNLIKEQLCDLTREQSNKRKREIQLLAEEETVPKRLAR